MQPAGARVTRARSIPEATVGTAAASTFGRSSTMAESGATTVSSEALAEAAGVNSAKVRKDLSHLGSYGTRGVGYDVAYLIHQIRARARPDPGLGDRDRRHRQPRARPGELPRVRRARIPRRGAGRRRSGQGGAADRAAHGPPRRRPARAGADVRDRDRRDRHPGRPPCRRSPTGWWPRDPVDPELRARGDRGAARGVSVRKVDLAVELQILAFYEQRKATLPRSSARPRGADQVA